MTSYSLCLLRNWDRKLLSPGPTTPYLLETQKRVFRFDVKVTVARRRYFVLSVHHAVAPIFAPDSTEQKLLEKKPKDHEEGAHLVRRREMRPREKAQ